MSVWFPTPASDADVELLAPSGAWSAGEVRALFTAPDREEWRHKVGVTGAADGSAKPTTRLLAARGWVLKTRLDLGSEDRAAVLAVAEAGRTRGRAIALWHPHKVWALVASEGLWYPVTLTPGLTTLRARTDARARLDGWLRMLQLGVEIHALHSVGLDLSPANFGHEPRSERLYYIDEEVYDGFGERNVADAIMARVPESAESPQTWRRWGETLRATLDLRGLEWDAIVAEAERYPIAERFDEERSALLSGLTTTTTTRRRERTDVEEIVCVLADVHGNLAALEAVLEDAAARGATRHLFLGDAVGYGPEPAACVRRLAELPSAGRVRGNHDHAIATGTFELGMNSLARECASWTRTALSPSELQWLAALPVELIEDSWMAVHGAPKDPRRFLAYVYDLTYEENLDHLKRARTPVCFYGHSHVQLIHTEVASGPTKLPGARSVTLDARRPWLVNPGSVGQPRDEDPRAAYALWAPATGALVTRRVGYDVDRTTTAIRKHGLPIQLEQRLRAGT